MIDRYITPEPEALADWVAKMRSLRPFDQTERRMLEKLESLDRTDPDVAFVYRTAITLPRSPRDDPSRSHVVDAAAAVSQVVNAKADATRRIDGETVWSEDADRFLWEEIYPAWRGMMDCGDHMAVTVEVDLALAKNAMLLYSVRHKGGSVGPVGAIFLIASVALSLRNPATVALWATWSMIDLVTLCRFVREPGHPLQDDALSHIARGIDFES